MYLHIGKDIILKKEDILFILDYENLEENKTFKEFKEKIEKKNILDISYGKKKSIIITKQKDEIKAYISNISSTTLAKRKIST